MTSHVDLKFVHLNDVTYGYQCFHDLMSITDEIVKLKNIDVTFERVYIFMILGTILFHQKILGFVAKIFATKRENCLTQQQD